MLGSKWETNFLRWTSVFIFSFELPHSEPVIHAALNPQSLHSLSQVNGVDLHGEEHHTAVEALRNSGAAVVMTIVREHMVEPENAITTTPLRPEDDYFPRERRSSGLPFLLDPASPAVSAGPMLRLATCLARNDKGLGFSIAGGKGSTLYRVGDTVNTKRSCIYTRDLACSEYFMMCYCVVFIASVSGCAVWFTEVRTCHPFSPYV